MDFDKIKRNFIPSPFLKVAIDKVENVFGKVNKKSGTQRQKTETDGTHLETMSGRRYGDQCSKSLTTYKIVICQNNEQKV